MNMHDNVITVRRVHGGLAVTFIIAADVRYRGRINVEVLQTVKANE